MIASCSCSTCSYQIYISCNVQAGPYDSLKDVAVKILENKVTTVPIIHSSSQDGSFPQLLHLASLSGILKCKLLNNVLRQGMSSVTN